MTFQDCRAWKSAVKMLADLFDPKSDERMLEELLALRIDLFEVLNAVKMSPVFRVRNVVIVYGEWCDLKKGARMPDEWCDLKKGARMLDEWCELKKGVMPEN